MEIRHYISRDGKDVFQTWLDKLRDITIRARLEVRISRLERGFFGDCKAIKAGVSELRIDTGPGFRIYFAKDGEKIVLLLCGGDKRTQQKDIENAIDYWKDYQTRNE